MKRQNQPPGLPLSGRQEVGRVETSTGSREGGEIKIKADGQQGRCTNSSPDKGRLGGVGRPGGVGCGLFIIIGLYRFMQLK